MVCLSNLSSIEQSSPSTSLEDLCWPSLVGKEFS